jgi:hypothetical protein
MLVLFWSFFCSHFFLQWFKEHRFDKNRNGNVKKKKKKAQQNTSITTPKTIELDEHKKMDK